MLDLYRLFHFLKLMRNVTNLKQMCDVNLIAEKDNRKFPVHRLIMRASSDYFDALLGPNFREGSEENVVLQDIDGETLSSIICYIYHGEITIDHRNVCAIAAASSWMQLDELEKRCADFGLNGLNAKNCVEVLLDADEHYLAELKSRAFDMTCANYEKFTSEDIAKIDKTTFRELLMCERLSGTETAIFNGLVRWIKVNEAEKSNYIPDFLKLIRLEHIPTQILLDTVKPFFVEHKQRKLISREYRERLFRPKNVFDIGRRRPKEILLVSASLDEVQFTKYDQKADDWAQIKTIGLESYGNSLVVANDKLYIMSRKAEDAMYAYDLRDFTRFDLPNMIKIRDHFTSVAIGNHIYVFGGIQNMPPVDVSICERYDIEKKTWTTRNNMPIRSWSPQMTAIEYNGLIHVGFIEHYPTSKTLLYRYSPANDTWKFKVEIANRAIFAKTSTNLYVIENDRVLHRYDPNKGVLTRIGDITFTGKIERTIEFRGEIYLLGENQFVKLDIQKNVAVVKLAPAIHRNISEYQLYVK